MVRSLIALGGVCLLTATTVAAQSPPSPPSPEPPEPAASSAVRELLVAATQQMRAAKPTEGLATTERALAAATASGDGAGRAQSARLRAVILVLLRRDTDALAAWREARSAWTTIGFGPGQVEAEAAECLLLRGTSPDEAEAHLRSALALAQAESARPLGAAMALFSMGSLSYTRRDFDLSARITQVASETLGRREPDTLRHAAALQGLGAALFELRRIPASDAAHRRALEIRRRLAPNSPELAMSESYVGLVLLEAGSVREGREYLLRSTALWQQVAPNSLPVAQSLNNLGVAEHRLGDIFQAEVYYRKSMELAERLAPDSPEAARPKAGLADVLRRRGDLDGAQQYLDETLRVFRKASPDSADVAGVLAALSAVTRERGDLDSARRYRREATEILAKLAPDSFSVATGESDAGGIELDAGHLTEALRHQQRALELMRRIAPNSVYHAQVLIALARTNLLAGQSRQARDLLTEARRMDDGFARNSPVLASLLGLSARVEFDLGDRDEAERLALRGWEIVRGLGSRISGDESRAAYARITADYLADVLECRLATGRPVDSLRMVEEGRAQSLLQLFVERPLLAGDPGGREWEGYRQAATRRDLAASAASDATIAVGRAEHALEEGRRQGGSGVAAQHDLESARLRLSEASAAYTTARLEAEERWSRFRASRPAAFTPVAPAADLLTAVPARASYASFVVGRAASYLFLVPAGGNQRVRVFRLSAGIARLTREVSGLLKQISRRSPDILTDARRLFAALFPGEAGRAVLGSERLMLSPDGPLWNLPFAALATSPTGPPRYLGEAVSITYTPALSLLARRGGPEARAPKRGATVAALVVGDVAFRAPKPPGGPGARAPGGERRLLFPDGTEPSPLPGTRAAAGRIAALYGTRPITGTAATETAVRARMAGADVIHLATHGYLNPYRAMSSGLLLAAPVGPVTGSDGDGALLAWEIQNQLRLRADLVVLAACETGRGEVVQGEGVLGLARALQSAGARSVVASLWKVDEAATMRLTLGLHTRIRAGMPKDQALRDAMRSVRSDPATAHPFYWAAFYLVGEPDGAVLRKQR